MRFVTNKWCWIQVKCFISIVMQMEACLDYAIDFCMSCFMLFYMFSNYCCSMTFLKCLRVLNKPLKESCSFSIKHKIVVFSFDALFGLTWHMVISGYDFKPVTLSLYDHLVFDL